MWQVMAASVRAWMETTDRGCPGFAPKADKSSRPSNAIDLQSAGIGDDSAACRTTLQRRRVDRRYLGDEGHQESLESHAQQHRGQDQRLDVPVAVPGEVFPEEAQIDQQAVQEQHHAD